MKTHYVLQRPDGTVVRMVPQEWPSDAAIVGMGIKELKIGKIEFMQNIRRRGYKILPSEPQVENESR